MESLIDCVLKWGDEGYMTRLSIDQTKATIKRKSARSKLDASHSYNKLTIYIKDIYIGMSRVD